MLDIMKMRSHRGLCNADRNGRILKTDQSSRILAFPAFFSFRRFRRARQRVNRVSMLSELEVGSTAIIESVDLPPGVHNHLMYMGFLPNARVQVLHRAPAGDPTVYAIDGLEIALRHETARRILVRSAHAQAATNVRRPRETRRSARSKAAHSKDMR